MKKFLLACFMLAFAFYSSGQERTVSGRVTSTDDGSALPGVNVVVKGTTIGTVTDANGNYSLRVSGGGQSLLFSFIGFQTLEVPVGDRTTVDVQLTTDVQQLSEVIVTAQGIQREKKALGYAATTVSASDFVGKTETDIGRALAGRTPGINIANSSGLTGSGSKINIRGISSFTGNTQPLWIVDGVPVNTAANDANTDFRDGQIAPTRFLDIDPNNIESINVLRGLSATSLYGSLGRNGVIIVTTKAGASARQKNKFDGSVSQSYYVIEAILPEFQNKWANGFDGDYGEFFSNWGRLFEYTDSPNQGSRHPYFEHRNTFPEFSEFNNATGYVPRPFPNNVKDFFQKGRSTNTNLNLGFRLEGTSLNFNYSHLDEEGFIENNNLKRDNFTFGGTANLTSKLTLTSTFNFVRTDFKTPPTGAGTGSNSEGGPSVFANLFYTPRNINLMGWPYQHPVTGGSVYYRNGNDITNPRWLLYNSQYSSDVNRFFGTMNLSYQLLDWLSVAYRLGLDTYSEDQDYWVNRGARGFPATAAVMGTGLYRSTTATNRIFDHSAIVTINKQMSDDLDLTGYLGFNSRADEFVQSGIESSNQVVYGLIEHRNFVDNNDRTFRGTNLNYRQRQLLVGAYFDAGLGFKNALYLNITGRNDWSSTHEEDSRSQFYPGISASFIPTSFFSDFASDALDFLKFRIGYGTSARFVNPYTTRGYLSVNTNLTVDNSGNVVSLEVPSFLPNPDIKPELQREIEAGIEAHVFDTRAKIDLSLYRRTAEDQIIQRTLDPSTGYETTFINAGTISNKGIELGLTLTAVRTSNFTWDFRTNFTKNVSKVEKLPEGSKEILISGFSDLGNFAIEGQPFNVIQGSYVKRSDDGQLVVNENGDWVVSDDIRIIGDPNPKWQASFINDLRYRGLSMTVMVDFVYGGDVFSYTAGTMVGRGVAKDLESFNPELPLILPGVKVADTDADGNPIYAPNDIPITTSGMFFGNTIIGGGASDRGIFDATRIRLREVSLNYEIPKSIVSKVLLKGANISVVGQNLWFRAFNAPRYSAADFDRTAFGTSNGAGFDFLGGPSARRYGVNLRLTF